MGLVELKDKLTQIKDEDNALLSYANERTGSNDTKLGDAVKTLADGFGSGGGNGEIGFAVGENNYIVKSKYIYHDVEDKTLVFENDNIGVPYGFVLTCISPLTRKNYGIVFSTSFMLNQANNLVLTSMLTSCVSLVQSGSVSENKSYISFNLSSNSVAIPSSYGYHFPKGFYLLQLVYNA